VNYNTLCGALGKDGTLESRHQYRLSATIISVMSTLREHVSEQAASCACRIMPPIVRVKGGRGKAAVGKRMLMVRCPDFVRSSRDEIDDERTRTNLPNWAGPTVETVQCLCSGKRTGMNKAREVLGSFKARFGTSASVTGAPDE